MSIKDRLDGVLHGWRYRRANERLATTNPQTLLFVCLGNVCRSPYAGRVASARLGDRVAVDSAGFIGPGRTPPDAALEVARDRGLDHRDHLSKVVTVDILDDAEAIFIFDRYNVARMRATKGASMGRVYWLGDLDPVWAGKRAIIDPWGKTHADFDRTFERIERCIDQVGQTLEVNPAPDGTTPGSPSETDRGR